MELRRRNIMRLWHLHVHQELRIVQRFKQGNCLGQWNLQLGIKYCLPCTAWWGSFYFMNRSTLWQSELPWCESERHGYSWVIMNLICIFNFCINKLKCIKWAMNKRLINKNLSNIRFEGKSHFCQLNDSL